MTISTHRRWRRLLASTVGIGLSGIALSSPPPAGAAGTTAPSPGNLVISEVSPANWSGATDADREANDWVELYNASANPIDISGLGISNKTGSPFRWVVPNKRLVQPGQYFTVWLSKKDRTPATGDLHANFNLDNGSDPIVITAQNGTATGITIDTTTPPLLPRNVSWCRTPGQGATGAFVACATPTFGVVNAGAASAVLAAPTITPPTGLYTSAQTVTITGPAGATIRYTTDGSEPTATSTLYIAPISVTSSRPIRAAAFQTGAVTSMVSTQTYVIDANSATTYANQRVIFVNMAPGDVSSYNGRDKSKSFMTAVEMLDAARAPLFKADAETDVAGQLGSGDSPQVSLNISFRDALGAKNVKTPAPLWPNKPTITTIKKLRLRNGSNDWAAAHIRDQFTQALSPFELFGASSSVAMFLNGNYYGLMDLREREDETLPESNYGIDRDSVYFINDPLLAAQQVLNGGTAALDDYRAMHNFVTQNDMTVAANYDKALTLLDPVSLIRDWVLHIHTDNYDWPGRNVHVWKSPAYDGRWHWQSHDMDFSFGRYGRAPTQNSFGAFGAGGSEVMNALLRNPNFKNLFVNVTSDMLNSTLAPSFMDSTLTAMVAEMRPYIPAYYAKVGKGAISNWDNAVNSVRTWAAQRESNFVSHLQGKFASSQRRNLTLSVSDPTMGSVKVNTLDLASKLATAGATWTGKYYGEIPVTLTAIPKPGFRFVGWQNASTATTATIVETLTTDRTYRAVFEAVPAGTSTAPVITPIGARTDIVGQQITLQVTAADPNGIPVKYSAKKLPSGLDLQPDTGRIYGTFTTPGTFTTVITATNGTNASTLTVSWTVNNRTAQWFDPTPRLVADSTTVAFGSTLVNSTATRNVVLTNPGTGPVTINTVGSLTAPLGLTAPTLPATVAAGSAITIPVTFAPTSVGEVSGSFMISASSGDTTVQVSATGSLMAGPCPATAAGWWGQYWNNTTLTGTPTACRDDAAVNFTWNGAAPATGVPGVNFSARWTKTQLFAAGKYTFSAGADDGVRLFVDGTKVIDNWIDTPYLVRTAQVDLTAGAHTIVMEMYQGGGDSRASLAWTVVPSANCPAAITGWKGEYFGNATLTGNPVLCRDDAAVNFTWGTAAPAAGLPVDGFSTRFTKVVELNAGTYRFNVRADDGVRVKVDGTSVIDSWKAATGTVLTGTATVASGTHTIVVEHYENTGDSSLALDYAVTADATCPARFGGWKGEYYNNKTLTGPAVLCRDDTSPNFTWAGAPDPVVPADGFSAKWTRTETFTGGSYTFTVGADDGIRLYVDGVKLTEDWASGAYRTRTATVDLTPGDHLVVLEYWEDFGPAQVSVSWKAATPPTEVACPTVIAGWKGEYFANTTLTGPVALCRDDLTIAFDYGTNGAAPNLPVDGFSARWTKSQAFDAGTYTFTVGADDGVRLFVDGTRVLDSWIATAYAVRTVDVPLTAGNHTIVLEYYEGGGLGGVALRWAPKATPPPPPATPGLTGTYFKNMTFTGTPALTRVERPAVNLGAGSGPAAGFTTSNWGIRWTGKLVPTATGATTIQTYNSSTDQVRVWVNNVLVIDNWTRPSFNTRQATVNLTAGVAVPIRIEFLDPTDRAQLIVSWKLPGQTAFGVIPTTAFTPT